MFIRSRQPNTNVKKGCVTTSFLPLWGWGDISAAVKVTYRPRIAWNGFTNLLFLRKWDFMKTLVMVSPRLLTTTLKNWEDSYDSILSFWINQLSSFSPFWAKWKPSSGNFTLSKTNCLTHQNEKIAAKSKWISPSLLFIELYLWD